MRSFSRRVSLCILAVASAVSLSTWTAGCGHGAAGLAGSLSRSRYPDIWMPAGASVLKIESVQFHGVAVTCYMIRLKYPGRDPSYAMWIPPRGIGKRPAVVIIDPYDGVPWSGDRPPMGAVHDCNHYVSSSSVFLLNDFGVLHVFGRFYTGGNLQNEVDDTTAGLRFLRDGGFADARRIGILGGSWGGFEALYGAAFAPAGAVPAAGVAFFPVSDFRGMERYMRNGPAAYVRDTRKRARYRDFFGQYLKRIHATPGWRDWTADRLLAHLATPFLIIHDEWDAFVPMSQSRYLVAHSGGRIVPVWEYEPYPVNVDLLPFGFGHGEMHQYQFESRGKHEFSYEMFLTLAAAYLINRLAPPLQKVIIEFDSDALNDFMKYLRDYQCRYKRNMNWVLPRLRDITGNRIRMLELKSKSASPGTDVLAAGFSAISWGRPAYTTGVTLDRALKSGLPACR